MIDRAHTAAFEQVREGALHRLPVLEHVARSRRGAEVVLEHEVGAVRVPDHVDPGDVCVHAARGIEAHHLAPEVAGAEHELGRDHPVAEDPLAVVDVVQEEVERLHPLDEASLQAVPVRARDHARDQVEGEDALEGILLVVDGEPDPLVQERCVDGPTPFLELLDTEPGKVPVERAVVKARLAGRVEHLVEERARVVFRSEE